MTRQNWQEVLLRTGRDNGIPDMTVMRMGENPKLFSIHIPYTATIGEIAIAVSEMRTCGAVTFIEPLSLDTLFAYSVRPQTLRLEVRVP